jgi:nucleotide-binding universal stress UspA family protein
MSRIVVGIDASDHAIRALDWALNQAALQGADVEMVCAIQAPDTAALPDLTLRVDDDELRKAAEHILDTALEQTSADRKSTLTIARTVTVGNPAPVLCRAAEGADLIVVGARGLGGFKELLVGSVSHQVVSHAPCPVVVVTPPRR